MAQETAVESLTSKDNATDSNTAESDKLKTKKDRSKPPTKVVIRLLPPSMTKEIFLEQVSPLPEYDYMYFVKADLELGQAAFSRAYINFINHEDIFTFSDQYDGYIFVDNKSGAEYPASVELAPFQRVPKKKAVPRKDSKAGTIEEDPMYIAFLESLAEELAEKENEHTFDYSYKPPESDAKKVTTTPLLEFLKQRRLDRQRSRDERKEDRRKKEMKEMERRKAREDEKKKRKLDFKDKESSNAAVSKTVARNPDKDGGVASTKDHDGKGAEKKFDDKPSFKDRKFQEGRNRDKPLPKQAAARQKTFESRPARDDRRSNEDLHKKPARSGDEKSEQAPKKPSTDGKKKFPEKDSGYSKPNRKEERYGDRKFDKDRDQPRKDDKPFREQQRREKDDRYGDKKAEESRPLKDRKYSDSRPRDRKNVDRKASELKHSDEPRERPGEKAEPKRAEQLPGSDGDKERRGSADDAKGRSRGAAAEAKSFQKSAESLGRTKEATTAKTRRSSLDSSKPEASSSGGKEVRRIHSLELDGPGPSPPPTEGAGSRAERRIRNKDRPSIEIYRPGMGRIGKQRAKE